MKLDRLKGHTPNAKGREISIKFKCGGPVLREGAIYGQNVFSNFNLYLCNAFKKLKLFSKIYFFLVYETA